jgi:hypothetical protein
MRIIVKYYVYHCAGEESIRYFDRFSDALSYYKGLRGIGTKSIWEEIQTTKAIKIDTDILDIEGIK